MAILPELPIGEVNNRELGESVREKINEIIRFINNIEEVLPEGPPGPRGPDGIPGPDLRVLLNVIGFSETVAGFPEEATLGDAWLIVGDGSDVGVYIFNGEEWIFAFEFSIDVDKPFINVLYVSKSGDDQNNNGLAPESAFLTIAQALTVARDIVDQSQNPVIVCVKVFPGTYVEDGNLEIPANCGVTSEGGQYVTEVVASGTCRSEFRNMFLVNSGSYVQGFTFRNQAIDNFNDPSGGFAVAFAPGAKILRSPYVRDIGQVSNYFGDSIANPLDPVPDGFAFDDVNYTTEPNPLIGAGGGTLLADRAVLNPNSIFPYMLAFGATPRSTNGIGYVAKNGAGINGISSISVFQQCAFYSLNGGQITLNNSGTQFGDISMRARGFTWVIRPVDAVNTHKSSTAADLIVGATEQIVDDLWDALVEEYGGLIDTPENEEFTRRDAENLIRSIKFDLRGGTDTVTKSFVLGLFDFKGDYVFDEIYTDSFIFSWEFIRDELSDVLVSEPLADEAMKSLINDVVISTVEGAPNTEFIETVGEDPQDALAAFVGSGAGGSTPKVLDETTLNIWAYDGTLWNNEGSTLKLRFGSLIESLGHQFNNAGAGVNKNALPLNFRRPGQNRAVPFTVLQEARGRVRFSGADELNNQYFAGGTRINGTTGKLEGRPFDSAVRQIARRLANSRGFI